MDPTKDWTIQELGAYIAVSWAFLQREIKRGHLAATKIGRTWRIHADDVTRYLESKRVRVPMSTTDRQPSS